MFNSKALLFSCAIFMIFWNGINAEIVAAIRAQYPRYHGTIVLPNNTAHPTSLCKEHMNSPQAFWVNYQEPHICNSRIRCVTSLFTHTTTLDKFPPEGSVGNGWFCKRGQLCPVEDVDKYQ